VKVKFISLVHGIIVLFVITSPVFSQNEIKPLEDYSTQIGVIVSMMDDLKSRVTASVVNLDQKGTDFLLDEDANRIGAMILHLAATEKYYQLLTFENRGFNEEEKMVWGTALSLGQEGREGIVGQPTDYYLEIWDIVRQETKRLLKTKDDKWLNAKIEGEQMNNHFAWYHVMEHQANHMGQIRLIIKRI
jgi:hypothetical protein